MDGYIKLPPMMRASFERLETNGAYLLGKMLQKLQMLILIIGLSRYWIRFILVVGQIRPERTPSRSLWGAKPRSSRSQDGKQPLFKQTTDKGLATHLHYFIDAVTWHRY